MTVALRALLQQVIDYAGLFPPADLSLSEAIGKFAEYHSSEQSWILRHFILPSGRLIELADFKEQLEKGEPWTFSVLAGRSLKMSQWPAALHEDFQFVANFVENPIAGSSVAALEIALPEDCPSDGSALEHLIGNLLDALAAAGFGNTDVFIEAGRKSARSAVAEILGQFGPSERLVGYKLRTGGISGEAFPSLEELAGTIQLCESLQIPWKATAGLHHALPHDCAELGVTMQGFLNLLTSVVLLHGGQIQSQTIENILIDGEASHFSISDTQLHWQEMSADISQIEAGRGRFLSFGSCSFTEPLADLATLGWMEELFQ